MGNLPNPRHTMPFWQLITVHETILVTLFDLMVFAKGGGLDGGTQLWQKTKSKGRRPKKCVKVTAPSPPRSSCLFPSTQREWGISRPLYTLLRCCSRWLGSNVSSSTTHDTLVRIFSKGLPLAGRGSGLVRWQARMENWAW